MELARTTAIVVGMSLLLVLAFLASCQPDKTETKQVPPSPTQSTPATTQAAEPTTQAKPDNWYVQAPKVNPIDGTKTQFLSTSSHESSGVDYIAGITVEKHTAKIVLCFQNGKLCRSPSVGARIDVDGFVTSDEGSVRLRFDSDKPIYEHWSGVDSHDALYPYKQGQFLAQLLHHKRLYFEFHCYEKASQVVTFDVDGLADQLKDAGIEVK